MVRVESYSPGARHRGAANEQSGTTASALRLETLRSNGPARATSEVRHQGRGGLRDPQSRARRLRVRLFPASGYHESEGVDVIVKRMRC